MNLIAAPRRARPNPTRMIPAMRVAMARPSTPCRCTMAYTITTNAPVGPPICTREPPRAEIRKPATIAVNRPRSGPTPLAIANAIASGSATIPTITPAVRSVTNCPRVYPLSVVKSFGTSVSRFPPLNATGESMKSLGLAREPQQMVQRERPGSHGGQRHGRDDQHQVVLEAPVLHEEALRPVHLGDRDGHRGEHQQSGERCEQTEHEQYPGYELPPHRQRRPCARGSEPHAPDEAGGALEPRPAERPERLLRPVRQEHRPQRQTQQQ